MNSTRSRRLEVRLVSILLVACLVGCAGSGARTTVSTATTATTSTSGAGGDTGTNSTVDSGTTPLRTGEGSGPGDFVLLDPAVGLAGLSSYRSSLTVSFEGKASGTAKQWTNTSTMVRRADPAAAVTTSDVTGDTDPPAVSFAAEAEGTAYLLDRNGKCTADIADPNSSLVASLEPAMALDGVVGADTIGSKLIGGVSADGYRFDERAIGLDGLAHAQGEVWVAHDGGYILDYHVTTTGNEELFGPGTSGTLTEQYTLSDIAQPISLDLPDDCPPVFLAGPVPDDAKNVVTGPGLLSFDATSSISAVLTFYQDAATRLGWSTSLAPQVGTDGAVTEFTTDGKHLLLSIASTDTGTSTTLTEVQRSAPTDGGTPPSGSAAGGEATIQMSGGHPLNALWPFVPEMSFFSGTWTLTFTDPANPLPAGSFLTLSLTPGSESLSFSDGQMTINAGPDACIFAVDQQTATQAKGTVTCRGVTGLGGAGGTVDVAVTVNVGG
jgi:hypothetical protein